MPTFMDRHDLPWGTTPEQVADVHVADLRWQDAHGVRFLTYWFDPERRAAFCLAEGPDAGAVERCHLEAHGLVPHTILEVDQRSVSSFLGSISSRNPDLPASHRRSGRC
jgi:hypothetical protein